MTLTEFLLARIEEDRTAAQESADATRREPVTLRPTDGQQTASALSAMEHIVRHDSARVLAECAARRRIVETHDEAEAWYAENTHAAAGELDGLVTAIKYLAAVFADHPDYDETWRP